MKNYWIEKHTEKTLYFRNKLDCYYAHHYVHEEKPDYFGGNYGVFLFRLKKSHILPRSVVIAYDGHLWADDGKGEIVGDGLGMTFVNYYTGHINTYQNFQGKLVVSYEYDYDKNHGQ